MVEEDLKCPQMTEKDNHAHGIPGSASQKQQSKHQTTGLQVH